MKIAQIKIGRSKPGTDHIIQVCLEKDVDLLRNSGTLHKTGLSSRIPTKFTVIQNPTPNIKNKSFIVILNPHIHHNTTIQPTDNIVTTDITYNGTSFTIISIYFEPHTDIADYISQLNHTLFKINRDNIVFCGDVNAASSSWGAENINKRGATVEEFMAQYKLLISVVLL